MTDLEIYKTLMNIDNGHEVDDDKRRELSRIESIHWQSIDSLPKCLGVLSALTCLTVKSQTLKNINAITQLKNLKRLKIQSTKLNDIDALSKLTSLVSLELRSTEIKDINGLKGMLSLRILRLPYNYCLTDISSLSSLTELKRLSLRYSSVKNIDVLANLTELEEVDLYGTRLNDISVLSKLHYLQRLDLRNAIIASFPRELLDLNLELIEAEKPSGSGIYIHALSLRNNQFDVFKLSRELIRAYYEDKDQVPINECKVIFLGDSESGKTYSIKRLLNHGNYLKVFEEGSTPGIEISVDPYMLRDDFVINYWDFGGQEVQHEMHRMFLTDRTAYVVMLNARQDSMINERADYWLENIRTFAPNAPVLLVINKIDLNPKVAFKERETALNYEDHIHGIVRMSALKDEPEIFLRNLQNNIINMIKTLPAVSKTIPRSWKVLIDKIRSMKEPYFTSIQFQKLCLDNNIHNYEDIHDDLVQLFQDIGVSFCYQKDFALSDYMLLNPKWLLNALYTFISNSETIAVNGIIKQQDLYGVLKESIYKNVNIRRVIQDIRYESHEVNYILGVTRLFRISHHMKNGSEFFPMLCSTDEKAQIDEIVTQNAIHFIFQYSYLPSNVIHRLVVDLERDLDYELVWFNGAVFRNTERNQIAFVHSNKNELHIYVDGEDSFYNPNEYLMPIRDSIMEINNELGLSPKEYVTFVVDGVEDRFSYRGLIGSLHKGNTTIYSEAVDENIAIKEILMRYDVAIINQEKELIDNILMALAKLQNNHTYFSATENERNTYIRDVINGSKYICKDQTLAGSSFTRKSFGELDIRIEDKNNHLLAIYEGLNLCRFDKKARSSLDEHICRLLDNYNSEGNKNLILVSYTDWEKKTFSDYILRYIEHIKEPVSPVFRTDKNIVHIKTDGFLRCMKLSYNCGDILCSVYHVIVRVAP